jgi:hypothetical protein
MNTELPQERQTMTKPELIELLKADVAEFNKKRPETGADLRGANLTGANLSYAHLGDANLSYANLRYANLRYAHLGDADLRGADLGDADLRDTDLRDANLGDANLGGALGVLFPQGNDPRGYRIIANWKDGSWWLKAGCRHLSVSEALTHWGNNYSGDRAIGDMYLGLANWLVEQPSPRSTGRQPKR